MEYISTRPYRMPKSQFLRWLIFEKMVIPLLLISALIVVAIIVGIIFDLRFLIVGAMIVFIIAPMLIAFAYIIYGMSPRCYPNTTLHTLDFHSDKIVMRWKTAIFNPEDEDVPKEAEMREMSVIIPIAEINQCSFGLKGLTLHLKGRPYGFVYAPYETFPESTDFKKLAESFIL